MSETYAGLKCCVVGAGFFGAVAAQRVAEDLGVPVLLIDRRRHIGGNSYSEVEQQSGIEVHSYGSHIFHTLSQEVWDYITRFGTFNSYRHRVWTTWHGRVYSMPINLATINSFYGKAFSPEEAREFLAAEVSRDALASPANFEEKAVSLIGRPLYEAFIKGYSEKQWETSLTSLPPSVINRLPVRFSYNDHYFDDASREGIPVEGYTGIFRRLLADRRITVRTGVDYFSLRTELPSDCLIIYTGPVDRYFNYKHGVLGWRTLDFEKEVLPLPDYQGTSVMNYAERDVPFTRVHEFKHYHPERPWNDKATVIFREYSRFAKQGEEPFYPINTEQDKSVYALYRAEADKCSNVIFGGRLATYKYLDMDQVIGAALVTYRNQIKPRLQSLMA